MYCKTGDNRGGVKSDFCVCHANVFAVIVLVTLQLVKPEMQMRRIVFTPN